MESSNLSAAQIDAITTRFESPASIPFAGLLASFPLNDREHLIAYTSESEDSVRCHVIPNDQVEVAIDELSQRKKSADVEPSIANLDRIEPLLRCATSGQPIVVYGCTPDKTMSIAWQMVPPSCRHELTFAAPPFKQEATCVYFSPEFDATRIGKRSNVIVDLSKSCPLDVIGDAALGWSIAVHGQLFSEAPAESLQEFYSAHCNAATLSELEEISRKWCEEEEHADLPPQQRELRTVQFVDAAIDSAECDHNLVGATDDNVIEQLGRLDDAVFDAIAGTNDGLVRMRELWPLAKSELSPHLIDESREHYLRYIVNEWTQRSGEELDPNACLPTIEVMRILLDGD